MSIEKMEFVNIAGLKSELDPVLEILSDCGCFHMDPAANHGSSEVGYGALKEENPYVPVLKLLEEISAAAKIKFSPADYSDIENTSMRKHERHLRIFKNKLDGLIAERNDAAEKLKAYEQALEQVNHLTGLDFDMKKIFECEYIKVRFGRLPVDSYEKLPYYEDRLFYFTRFTQETEYYWGLLFTPVSCAAETEEIFESLYFEKIRIADFVHGNTEDALTELSAMIDENKSEYESHVKCIDEAMKKEKPFLDKLFSLYKSHHDTFDLRNMVAAVGDKFHIIGFVPKSESESFMNRFDELESVSVLMQPADTNGKLQPPVKLKNNKFTRPFSMFVEMYGLPSYNGINPTTFVAVTYTLLFGIMFGDVGQGLVLAIAGTLLWKFKRFALGPILTRIGISGAFFGLLYGSVFGFEELLDPVYEALGIDFLPFKIMDNVAPILVAAIAIGVLIMQISIVINIVMGIKNKHYAEALFGNNGIAGLIFFGSILFAAVGTLLGMKIISPVYIAVFIILPLIMMFMREPLSKWVRGKEYKFEDGIVDFIASNFFEVFEFLLGYATNTLSFVRIGGFVLSHASMMLVVMALAEQVSGAAVPVVVIFGNIFVMGIEGLLVGIQTLRLEFYEIFSRFYSGDGRPFTPVKINYDENME